MKQKIRYEERDHFINLLGAEGDSAFVEVPEEVKGRPVKWLAPYAFSVTRPENFSEGIEWENADLSVPDIFSGEMKERRGSRVESIILPGSVERIGNYCFYGCNRLKCLKFTDQLTDIGGGAFTGCRLRRVEIDFYRGEKSCLKDVLAEVRYELSVILRYHCGDGRVKTAKLLFPEHYEEAVENTPARIVMTHYHGSGGNYRQCFYNKTLDFKEYDELFSHAAAWESQEVLIRLVFGRLKYPFRLLEPARERYREYLKSVSGAAAKLCIGKEDMQGLQLMVREGIFTREGMEDAIQYALDKEHVEAMSFLMEERRRLFPERKKVFVW